jgi:hypothetical protein
MLHYISNLFENQAVLKSFKRGAASNLCLSYMLRLIAGKSMTALSLFPALPEKTL